MRALQALFSLSFTASCIPIPHKDYEEFLEASASYRTTTSSDAAIDAKPPEMAIEQTYYVACLPSLSAGDARKALRFYAESKFVPNGDGTGKLSLQLTPIAIRDPNVGDLLIPDALKFEKVPANGTLAVTDVAVAKDARFTADFKTAMVPKTCNALSFRDIQIDGTTMKGVFGAEVCGGLSGQIVAPIMQDLGVAEDNICVFKPLKSGEAMPDLKTADYKCTL